MMIGLWSQRSFLLMMLVHMMLVFLSANVIAYFSELFGKIMANNQIREDQIMIRIEVVTKEDEEGQEKMKEEIKVVMKESEAQRCYGTSS